jgi:hypothetical protein
VLDDGGDRRARRVIVAVGDRAEVEDAWVPERRIDAAGQS